MREQSDTSRWRELSKGWRLFQTMPGDVASPDELDPSTEIGAAIVPGTVAQAMVQSAPVELPLAAIPNPDEFDWWYACVLPDNPDGDLREIVFDGLATLAEVWADSEHLLECRNMFRRYRVKLPQTASKQTLWLVFRSVTNDLRIKRKRPGWKTNLVNHQQLRWIRTTLLGRIPGWTPPIPAVGPWRAIRLYSGAVGAPVETRIATRLVDEQRRLSISLLVEPIDRGFVPTGAFITLGDDTRQLSLSKEGASWRAHGELTFERLALWFPHTHGRPALHELTISLAAVDGPRVVHESRIGWKQVEIDRDEGRVDVSINGTSVFCRGGCWATNDIVTLQGNPSTLRATLSLIRKSGANMIRVGGTMVYESDLFYALCDEFGLLVWQDFMFANMDYPVEDLVFRADVEAEIREQVSRLLAHPCTTVFCGNSEVEQQSAMFGLPSDRWRNDLFYELLPRLLNDCGSNLPYFPSSPCEGALPFHNREGISHYFGVGAYRRSIDDVRLAGVRFASECLAFSNMPDDVSMREHFDSSTPPTHTPEWKSGVPRDNNAGWDFEDIRDHYLATLFDVKTVDLRYSDRVANTAHAKIVTGEIMRRVFTHWRRAGECGGGLIWFLKDIVPGAGWGVIDSDNRPKPAWYFLKRAWAPVVLSVSDDGLDGLAVDIVNETSESIEATLHTQLLRHSQQIIASHEFDLKIPASTTQHISVDAMFGRFLDTGYHYRFGPPAHNVVTASLISRRGTLISQDAWFPNGYHLEKLDKAQLTFSVVETRPRFCVTLQSAQFLQYVHLKARGFEFEDNYFHLIPGIPVQVNAFCRPESDDAFEGTLGALNLASSVPIR